MKICFYADLYWIFNFIMNLFLIYLTAYIRQRCYRPVRWIFLSAITALIAVVGVECMRGIAVYILAILSIFFLTFFSLMPGSISAWFWDMLTFICSSMTVAGSLLMVKEIGFVHQISLWMLLVSVFVLFILFRYMGKYILRQKYSQKNVVPATLIHGGSTYQIKVLYDTGNQLISPYTGEAVMIISKKLVEKIGNSNLSGPLIIPYHSIGGDGILTAYRFESLETADGKVRENFLAAVTEKVCVDSEIHMILNVM